MNNSPLRIEQYETVLFNANLNPHGIPVSVRKSIEESIDTISKYPDIYYNKLKHAVSEYADVASERIVMGNGSTDLLKIFATQLQPKKTMVIVPGPTEYEKVMTEHGSEMLYYELKEEDEFILNTDDLIASLTDDIDLLMFANPNNPTSKKIVLEDIEKLVKACKDHNIFILIDEMYIEFVDDYKDITSVHLTDKYDNMAVLRSVSKFFAVPGLRFAYAIINSPSLKEKIDLATTKNNVASLTAIAVTNMFNDKNYISQSVSTIHTERSLVYLAMSTGRSIHLFRPDANFMLVKLLKDDITSADVAAHCSQRGIIIRKCDDIRGLSDKYIRFCFMNPKQNDLMVNTILEIV